MRSIYLDNAATAFPKAPGVGDAMKNYIENIGCSVKRGVYSSSLSVEETVFETRELLGKLFNFDKPENVIFTMNITQGLNYLLKGLLKPGDHCVVSSMEHNAVMRPLNQLADIGIFYSRVMADKSGQIQPEKLKELITSNTKAVIMTHVSNVCGTVLPLLEIGKVCKEAGVMFIIDSAQSAGVLDIDYKKLNADAIAFTGHKGLLGPQGIGGFVVSNYLAGILTPLICGGTGSDSKQELQPEYMPDKFEPGTPNIPGIYGLHAALKYLDKIGIKASREAEMELTSLFISEIRNIFEARVIGHQGMGERTAVVSVDFPALDNGEAAYYLDRDYGIMTRSGLHCAPSAHKTLGTFPNGTVRFSFSHFNTLEDVRYTIDAINRIVIGRG